MSNILDETGLAYLINKIKLADNNLQTQITNLLARGRYLSLWNSVTGLATTLPSSGTTYSYRTGDYFIVAIADNLFDYKEYDSSLTYNIGDKCKYNNSLYICNTNNTTGEWDSTKWTIHTITNYKPNGSQYVVPPVASTTLETEEVSVNDTYYYDGSNWTLLHTRQPSATVSFESIEGNATDNESLSEALNAKVDKVTGKQLSTNDFDNSYKNKLDGIESGAEVNDVNSVNTKTGDVVLDADDIDDTNTTNKFVTTQEKQTWNNKQNALSSTQLNAVNSGIDTSKVSQIETNRQNILTKSTVTGTNDGTNWSTITIDGTTFVIPLNSNVIIRRWS